MGTYLRKTHFIEGIGNEVLFGVAAFAGVLIPMVAYVLNRQRQVPVIHPDSAANVETTRAQLREEATRNQNENQTPRARSQNNGQLICPICLGEAVHAVETNCGHVYCGHCITTYWEHQNWLGAVPCPSCRTRVTILLQNFTDAESSDNSEDKEEIIRQINHYNRRFSGEPRPWRDYIRDLPTLLRHAWSEFFSLGGLIWMFRIRVIVCFFAAFFYFISPLDIIPEAAFGILGFLDDLFIILLLAIYVSIIYRQIVEARAERGVLDGERT